MNSAISLEHVLYDFCGDIFIIFHYKMIWNCQRIILAHFLYIDNFVVVTSDG